MSVRGRDGGTFTETKPRINASYSFEELTARTVTCYSEREPKAR